MGRRLGLVSLIFIFLNAPAVMAQNASVKLHVQPKEAFVFVDGQAIGDGERMLKLTPGKHTVGVYNYGYNPIIRELTLSPGVNESQRFDLSPAGGPVTAAQWGVLQIEGAPYAAVLLNGKQPEYFVGHGDEFNHHLIWKQQLLVPAGTHRVTVLDRGGEIGSWKIDVPANKRVILYAQKNAQTAVKDWSEGEKLQSVARFSAGATSATVAVAPVTGAFAASTKQINCNDKVQLRWNTTETLHTSITSEKDNFPELPMSGEETVSPRKTTTYQFQTSGPGGIVESSETVKVNPEVQAHLVPSNEDVHYLRIGDKVIVQDHATLTWNVTNADTVSLEPFGSVETAGSNSITPTPNTNAAGAVDETHAYKLVASNVCGGSNTKTVSVHLVGNIEPAISSVFFPTGYPDRGHPNKGLLKSQQERLTRIATLFKLYMDHAPDAKLDIIGLADPRGLRNANQILSARRAMLVKEFFIAQGIPADRLMLQIKGASNPIDLATVKQLESSNTQPPDAKWVEKPMPTKLAYDRRVDVAILPAALESARYFPHAADDAALLFDRRWLGEKQIHEASE